MLERMQLIHTLDNDTWRDFSVLIHNIYDVTKSWDIFAIFIDSKHVFFRKFFMRFASSYRNVHMY